MIWHINSGQAIQEIVLWPEAYIFWREAMSKPLVQAMGLSNDHRLLALSEGNSKTIEIWEVASATKRGELTGHAGPVVDLAFSPDGRQLASSSEDTTILVWDLNRPLQPAKFKDRLSEDELAAHWKTLFQPDAKNADTAIWSLVYAANDSVPFLKKQLRPDVRPEPKRVESLIATLESKDFKLRSRAETDLETLGELVIAELEESLKQQNTLEKKRRLEALFQNAKKATQPFGTAQKIGQWRAIEVLERISTAEATQLLRELSNGLPGTRLTTAAKAALTRLDGVVKKGK